jgi:hypothetical protein
MRRLFQVFSQPSFGDETPGAPRRFHARRSRH